MIYRIIYLTIVTCGVLLGGQCSGLQLSAESFAWQLIEESLNCSEHTENFVVAPYEAYQLYKQVFHIEHESNESDAFENQSVSNDGENNMPPVLPAIRKQYQSVTDNRTNGMDLLSSVSLSARWSFNFQTRDTHKRIFHQFGKANHKMWTDFLRKDDMFHYSHDELLNASILELPLNIKKIKFVIILPDRRDGLEDLKDYFLQNINELNDLINQTHKMILVRVLLPKFHLTYKKDLTHFFEVTSAKEVQDFKHIYQETNLEFNERGVGHFERTTVLFWNAYSYLRVAPEMFDINHPFLFLIINQEGVQFFGQVVQMSNQ